MAEKTRELTVKVRTHFLGEESSGQDDRNQYVFAYTVSMENTGRISARLLGRRWVITDGNGKVTEVVGEGVVGEHPYLRPGDLFQYTSSSRIDTPVGTMHGSYQMVGDDGIPFEAPIAPFRLAASSKLH
ncbi:MAG: Co2+/Mg2+ efflux protein ApaG [Methylococcaceae bacterium]